EALTEWEANARSNAYLVRGGRLDRLAAWSQESQVTLSRSEHEFLEASVAARDQETRLATEREEQRVAAERRARRRARELVAIGVVTVVVGALALFSFNQAQLATRAQGQIADRLLSQTLARQSQAHLYTDPSLAASLAVAAAQATAPHGYVTAEALDSLHWAFQEGGLIYPADEATPVAVRPGPRQTGLRGIFDLPIEDLIARTLPLAGLGFSSAECSVFFGSAAQCPDLRAPFPAGLSVEEGDEAYGMRSPDDDQALTGARLSISVGFDSESPGWQPEMEAFELATGILTTTSQVDVHLGPGGREEADEPLPDIFALPQPGAVVDYADAGWLIDLRAILDEQTLRQDYGSGLLSLVTADDGNWPADHGAIYGVPMNINLKGLIFYPPQAFAEAGYEVPATFDGLMDLSAQIAADGRAPWCFFFGSGLDATGWPGTDFLESLLVRQSSVEVYDDWSFHRIPFDAPEVRSAGKLMGEIIFTEGWVNGGSGSITRTDFADAGLDPLLVRPDLTGEPRTEPACWLYHQADFMLSWLPARAIVGEDIGMFVMPPMNEAVVPTLGGANFIAAPTDRPEVRRFLEHLASPRFGQIWASDPDSEFYSANSRFDITAYESDAESQATVRISLGERLRSSIEADQWRFDGSDLMPLEITTAFWAGMAAFADGVISMDEMLASIERQWITLEADS
ncbi:MAG TPA: ABC transporter substrate-binding protein, partial [Acidimicrobiia bacterium]|nr:ABC transporter substrate-binding protein [Acidimicrobiia bacterium]